jgi:outer membrane protein OmpA-like peptidoglycan-associated protein
LLNKFASAASALLLFAIGVQATSIAANATTQPDRTTTIVGFAPDSAVVPAKIKNQIVSFVAAHPNYTKVSCTGYTFDLGKKVTNFKLGLKRAQGACKAAVKASSALSIDKQSGNRSTAKKDQFRGVKIVLSSYVEPTATISFELNGGTSGTPNTS